MIRMAAVMTLKDRYEEVRLRVAQAAARSGRSRSDVLVVAVTKYAELDQIMELIELGHRDFGESRVQQFIQRAAYIGEWLSRRESLPNVAAERDAILGARTAEVARDHVRWHMIGEIQRNKARRVVECARLIHSVDSMRVAEEIQTICLKREEPVEALLQVNCSGDAHKHGVSLPAAIHVAEQIDSMTYVRLRGVMTMAPHVENPEDARFAFEHCRECFEEIRDAGIGAGRFNLLSMGMSSDFEVAIECGANIVRIGTTIFGEPVAGADAEIEREVGD